MDDNDTQDTQVTLNDSEPVPITNGTKKSKKFKADSTQNQEEEELDAAAVASRLSHDKMTREELELFADIEEKNLSKSFLYIRNKILSKWIANPRIQLTIEDTFLSFNGSFIEKERALVARVYKYLERYAYINFGVFKRAIALPSKPHGKVIVIGAGVAGLMAARQLREFGFEVVVYEARDRIGGRIATFRRGSYVADLGAMVVTGLGGNPIDILTKQITMDLVRIKPKCPLFDNLGKQVPKEKDDVLEKEFNKLLEATSYLSHNLEFNQIYGKSLSLGDSLELVIRLQEKHVKQKQFEYLAKYNEFQQKYCELALKRIELQDRILALSNQHHSYKEKLNKNDVINEFKLKSIVVDMSRAHENVKKIDRELDEIQKKLASLDSNPPSDMYLSNSDRQVLDWHFANLEFANATPLNYLSLQHWDQDDEYEFQGVHMTVRNGYSCVPIALSEGLKINLSKAAKRIEYSAKGVKVLVESTNASVDDKKQFDEDEADAVLVTLPLGVLKECATSLFEPQLPEWKLNSINNLGFGNLNKVIMCFEKPFWDVHMNLFGQIPLTTSSRGEIFLFWNLYKAPVLIALIAGEAANLMENVSDDIIVSRCLAILKSIWGNTNVPAPKETIVTRWKADPWSRGSYSFVSVNSSGNDYDSLAEPIVPPFDEQLSNSKPHKQVPRVFFGGEHTSRNYPATVPGALLSGLREARKIADAFLGSPTSMPK